MSKQSKRSAVAKNSNEPTEQALTPEATNDEADKKASGEEELKDSKYNPDATELEIKLI